MLRSPTVWEDVVKTVCTTNCTWALTRVMVTRARHPPRHAGRRPPGRPCSRTRSPRRSRWRRATKPSTGRSSVPATARLASSSWRRSLPRGGSTWSRWATASREDLPDAEVERRLLALPGVGPYAAAHIMMTLGRSSRLILDSWTRPTYARLIGRRAAAGRRRDRPSVPSLRPGGRARVLAVRHPRLGRREARRLPRPLGVARPRGPGHTARGPWALPRDDARRSVRSCAP